MKEKKLGKFFFLVSNQNWLNRKKNQISGLFDFYFSSYGHFWSFMYSNVSNFRWIFTLIRKIKIGKLFFHSVLKLNRKKNHISNFSDLHFSRYGYFCFQEYQFSMNFHVKSKNKNRENWFFIRFSMHLSWKWEQNWGDEGLLILS